jgi:ATP-binding cassette subfamily C (CFTR/MRP) protein 1
MTALPSIVAVCSFVVYTFAYNGASNNASTLFAALAAFDQLRFPLLFYPVAFAALAQAGTSAARVENYLNMKEVGKGEYTGGGHYTRDETAILHDEEKESVSGQAGEIIVKNATIYWSNPNIPLAELADDDNTSVASSNDTKLERENSTKSVTAELEEGSTKRYPKAVLNDVSLHVNPGELCAVVGRVAAGKSTLCSAVLNEAILSHGEIVLKGSVAYVAQSAWILNATLRDNILFGKPYNEEKYQRVIKACQLTYDIKLLPDGDQTEIGERGINVSGKSMCLVKCPWPSLLRSADLLFTKSEVWERSSLTWFNAAVDSLLADKLCSMCRSRISHPCTCRRAEATNQRCSSCL